MILKYDQPVNIFYRSGTIMSQAYTSRNGNVQTIEIERAILNMKHFHSRNCIRNIVWKMLISIRPQHFNIKVISQRKQSHAIVGQMQIKSLKFDVFKLRNVRSYLQKLIIRAFSMQSREFVESSGRELFHLIQFRLFQWQSVNNGKWVVLYSGDPL